jgi:type I restriction enzyme S subunit
LKRPLRDTEYEEYRYSGIYWLGLAPKHWSVQRLKYCVSRIETGGTPDTGTERYWCEDDQGIPWVAIGDLTSNKIVLGTDKQLTTEGLESKGLRILPVGTLLYSMYASLGKVAFLGVPATVNQAILGLVNDARVVERGFLRWWLEFMQLHVPMLSSSNTQDNLNAEKVRNMPIFVPSIPEQKHITRFLDLQTDRIDALIAKKERLIELLKEKRIALITRAATKGLNPTVPMKESGIEWLGNIPAHWEVAPLYSRYDVSLGKMLDAKRVTGDDLVPYLRNVDVQWDRVNTRNLPEMDFSFQDREKYRLRCGDLLVCEGGEVGRSAMWQNELDECYYQKAVHRLRPLGNQEVPRFFYYVLHASAKAGRFVAGGNPNTIDHLTAIQLRRYRFAFPPHAEQIAIVEFLDLETASLDELIVNIDHAVRLLEEYRTALISSAVIGKIDVRKEVA